MQVIAIQPWDGTGCILAGQVESSEPVSDEQRVVPIEIRDVKSSVQRPIITLYVKYFSERPVSPRYNPRACCFRFGMKASDSG
jgi:hypothetical protein